MRYLVTLASAAALALISAPVEAAWPPYGLVVAQSTRGWTHHPHGDGGALIFQMNCFAVTCSLSASRLAPDGTFPAPWPGNGRSLQRGTPNALRVQAVTDGANGVYVVTHDPTYNSYADLRVTRLEADGSTHPDWSDGGVLIAHDVESKVASAVTDGRGGLYVVWERLDTRYRQDHMPYVTRDLYALRLNPNGTPAQGWDPAGVPVVEAPANAVPAQLTFRSDVHDGYGALWIAWQDSSAGRADLRVLRLEDDGTLSVDLLITGEGRSRFGPSLLPDGRGGVYLSWNDEHTSTITRLTRTGSTAPGWPLTDLGRISPSERVAATSPVPDDAGGFLVATGAWDPALSRPTIRLSTHRVTPGGQVVPGWPRDELEIDPTREEAPQDLISDGSGGFYWPFVGQQRLTTPNSTIGRVFRLQADGTRPAGWPDTGLVVMSDTVRTWPGFSSDGTGGLFATWRHQRRTSQGAWVTQIRVTRMGADGMRESVLPIAPRAIPLSSFPNPSTGSSVIEFANAAAGRVELSIYDVGGRLVRRLHDGHLSAGAYQWPFDGNRATGDRIDPGVYFLRVKTISGESSRRIVITR